MRNFILNIITWFGIALLFWSLILFLAFNAQAEEINDQAMDIPTKCEYHRAKVREIQKQFADKIYILWLHEGSKIDPRKLYDQADYTAWYILRDNSIICRHYK